MANTPLRRAYEDLIKNKVADIYYLTKEDIGLSMDAMVEGVHPSDLGMQQYADSYIRKIREILHEEGGNSSACIPCKQQRDPYDWTARHEQVLDLNSKNSPEILMIGNSITHYWAGEPLSDKQSGKEAWEKLFKGRRVHNLGFGWDKTENVLWRIYHGELDGFQAKTIFLLIGTNNLQFNTDREILDAIMLLTKTIRNKQPAAKLYVIGLLPRKGMEERIRRIDSELQDLVSETDAVYIDLTPSLINKEGRIDASLFSDGLHPNEKGYERIASVLSSFL